MLGPIILIVICLTLLGLSIRLFLQGLRKTATEKVLNRLAAGQPQLAPEKPLGALPQQVAAVRESDGPEDG